MWEVIPVEEYKDFVEWYRNQYGMMQALNPPPNAEGLFEDPYYQSWIGVRTKAHEELEKATTQEEVEQLLSAFVQNGVLSEGTAGGYYEQRGFPEDVTAEVGGDDIQEYIDGLDIPQGAKEHLYQTTSKQDLADRLNDLNLPFTKATEILQDLSTYDFTLREAKGRRITAEEKNLEIERKNLEAREKQARFDTLSPVLTILENNPLAKKHLANISDSEVDAYLRGENDALMNQLADIGALATREQAATKQAGRADRALAGMMAFQEGEPRKVSALPPMPSGEKGIESFLGGTGLAEGTKLRSFLEGKVIPETVAETRGAREKWWKGMQPEAGGETFGQGMGRLEEEAKRWADIAEWAPTDLADIARKSYAGLQQEIGKKTAEQKRRAQGVEYAQSLEDVTGQAAYRQKYGAQTPEQVWDLISAAEEAGYGQKPKPKPEDPLILALRERKYRQEYFRRPGTGIVSRLQPSVRY